MMLEIEEGVMNTPLKIVVEGVEGVGKTTLVSKFPHPLFLDTEGSTARLPVRRIAIKTWQGLLKAIAEIRENPSVAKTVAVDTADWAEALCIRQVCAKAGKQSIEEFGYGKGYTYVGDEFGLLLKALDSLTEAGIHVVLIAHAKTRKYELPEEQGQFDRWEMKLSKQVAPLLKEWCDLLLFCTYKTIVIQTGNARKATGGKRVMYASHNPCWDAKNRFGLPDEMDLDYGRIAHLFGEKTPSNPAPICAKPAQNAAEKPAESAGQPKPERPTVARLRALIAESGVTEGDVMTLVGLKGHYPAATPIDEYSDDFILRWAIPNWRKIAEAIGQSAKGGKDNG